MYLNKIFIIGNLTKDPELKAMPSGTKVANFGLATNSYFKDKDGNKKERAEFHNVVVFGKMGELAATYLKKGSQALIEGRIQTRSWDATDGSGKKYRTEVIADNVQFGNRPGAGAGGGGGKSADGTKGDAKDGTKEAPGEAIEYPQEDINPDDIPF